MMKACSIEGCELPYKARGFCNVHYMRWWHHGDATAEPWGGSVEKRFWKRINKDADGGCWEWLGKRGWTSRNYGFLCDGPRTYLTHRLSWEIHNGPIPNGLWVLHRCDNPPCVNPAHLFLGTNQDNIADMIAKGRKVSVMPNGRRIAAGELERRGGS